MAYTVTRTNGDILAYIDPQTVNTTACSISLVGRGLLNYGEVVDNSLVHLLEHFSNTSSPNNAIEGQLWWDKTNQILKIYDTNGNWDALAFQNSNESITIIGDGEGVLFEDPTATINHRIYRISAKRGNNLFVNSNSSDTNAWLVFEELNDSDTVISNPLQISGDLSTLRCPPLSSASSHNPGVIINNGSITAAYMTIVSQDGVSSNVTINNGVMNGIAVEAMYADLAERYETEEPVEVGDLVEIGGKKEIRKTTEFLTKDVFGVISENPAFKMNENAGNDNTHPYVALSGRVKCKVFGKVSKGDRLVASKHKGIACAINYDIPYQCVFGRALYDKLTNDVELIEVVVGVK